MSITKLDCMELKDTRYSVYPYDSYNLEEILGKFYEAIKECNDLSFTVMEFNNKLISEGFILTSPAGKKFRLKVDDNGNLQTILIEGV